MFAIESSIGKYFHWWVVGRISLPEKWLGYTNLSRHESGTQVPRCTNQISGGGLFFTLPPKSRNAINFFYGLTTGWFGGRGRVIPQGWGRGKKGGGGGGL